ncbi:ATP-dependent helicase [Dactylosporangium sp. NPDC051485]|uniref:ATP-dependent helicase n=1 Tax=Dactylosporangium sp. NPDC051485 TaxID=3154846 RepID=UPI003448DD2E
MSARERADQEQLGAITAPAPLFVHACPGAGKTHVVVSRHLAGSSPQLRQGRALLSFTRAASQQMRRRCQTQARPDAIAFPHYLGTLDSFIFDVLVAPYLQTDRSWQLLDSWERLPASVKLDRAVPLHAFQFVYDPDTSTETVRRDLLDSTTERIIAGSSRTWSTWEQQAKDTRRDLYHKGYLTGHEARILALHTLRGKGDEVLGPLRSRFTEIIIDEAQDCSVVDLAILEHLHNGDVPLVVVGDPDQMIYGWRNADPKRLAALADRLGRTLTLTGNRRSTPGICRLAATLRTGQRPPDVSVADHPHDPPILLIGTTFGNRGRATHITSGRPVVDVFAEHAQAHGVAVTERLVTARLRATLPGAAARNAPNSSDRLARAWHTVHTGSGDADSNDRACRAAARHLLRYWYPDSGGSLETICATHQVRLDDLFRHAYGFLHGLPEPGPSWPKEVNQRIKTWPRPVTAAPRGNAGQLRTAPAGLPAITATEPVCRIDNVHQVKGDEHDAVLLLLPDDDILTRWRDGDPASDEILRTWYVAVTRARQMLALAIPADQLDGMERHLGALGASCTVQ